MIYEHIIYGSSIALLIVDVHKVCEGKQRECVLLKHRTDCVMRVAIKRNYR